MSLLHGSLVAGRFSVEELAGKGGMGEVFRARDVTTGELVALKLMHAGEGGIEGTERFQREARLLADLDHPGIVAYLAHGQADDERPFLAMEWLAGHDLSQRLAGGALRLDECTTLLAKAAEALAVAHRHGVVHRDIKPSNLFLRNDRIEGVTLLDFGIARWAPAGTSLTRTGALIGTIGYMAPEQARGEGDVGPSADVFSLGSVLFECLTGRAPFTAQDAVGVLAKVLFDDVPPVETLRPDTPPALGRLLGRMLDKDPARRPADGAMLCEELAGLELAVESAAGAFGSEGTAHPAVLTGDAMKLLCVVLAVPRADARGQGPASTETGDGVGAQLAHLLVLGKQHGDNHDIRGDRLRSRLVRLGGRVEWMADGSLAVIVPSSSSAMDQAVVAARCALAVQEEWPDARVALTTGRGLVKDRLPAGEAIDRAVSLVHLCHSTEPPESTSGVSAPVNEGVWLDELSAKLLEPRFVITTTTGQRALSGERTMVDESRPLLGRPTPCVGREQEISILSAAFERCMENSEPAGALVLAPAGMGKSRLKHEFLRRLRALSPDVQVLSGSGTPMSAGSPGGLLSAALWRLSGAQVGDAPALQEEKVRRCACRHIPAADAERVGEFIAALCGIAAEEPSSLLRAARSDPKIMTEQIQRAFLDFLGAETAARPCLLVLEDLHWGDAGSVKLVDAALLELRDRPFFVIAFARPEIEERFPRLWEARTVQRIPLAGLGKKAAERLITAVLGAEVPAGTIARLVEQAGGNALFLEELIRAAGEGKMEEQPDTVLAMLQARFSCLAPPVRRILCSASIFGQTFSRGGVVALLGEGRDTQQVDRALETLIQAEIVERQRSSRFAGDTEHKFRHVLLRDAAYGLLPEEDRILGHRLAGVYLEQAGEVASAVLAEHARIGGDLDRAAFHYLRAAEQSCQRDDYEGMFAHAEQGIACHARSEVLGALLALKLEGLFWRQDWQTGVQVGKRALELLRRGSIWWSKAVGTLILMGPDTIRPDDLAALTSVEPDPDAAAPFATAVAHVIIGLSMMGSRPPLTALLERLGQIELRIPEGELPAHGAINLCRFTFGHLLGDDPWWTYDCARRAESAYTTACATRYALRAAMSSAMAIGALGERAQAERRFRQCLEQALLLHDAFSATVARLDLLLFLAESCAPDHREEISALATQFIERGAKGGTVRLAHVAMARLLMAEGRIAEAREHAEKAVAALAPLGGYQTLAYRTLIEILLREGQPDTARQVAEEGLRLIESLGGSSGHSEVALRLAAAEARAAAGDSNAAHEALARTIGVIETRAAKIPDAALRACYFDWIPEHVRARELARTWLDHVPQGLAAARG